MDFSGIQFKKDEVDSQTRVSMENEHNPAGSIKPDTIALIRLKMGKTDDLIRKWNDEMQEHSEKMKHYDSLLIKMKNEKQSLLDECNMTTEKLTKLEMLYKENEKTAEKLKQMSEQQKIKLEENEQHIHQLVFKVKDYEEKNSKLEEEVKALQQEIKTSKAQAKAADKKPPANTKSLACQTSFEKRTIAVNTDTVTIGPKKSPMKNKGTMTVEKKIKQKEPFPIYCSKCEDRISPPPVEQILKIMSSNPPLLSNQLSPPKSQRFNRRTCEPIDFDSRSIVSNYNHKSFIHNENNFTVSPIREIPSSSSLIELNRLTERLNKLEDYMKKSKKKAKKQKQSCCSSKNIQFLVKLPNGDSIQAYKKPETLKVKPLKRLNKVAKKKKKFAMKNKWKVESCSKVEEQKVDSEFSNSKNRKRKRTSQESLNNLFESPEVLEPSISACQNNIEADLYMSDSSLSPSKYSDVRSPASPEEPIEVDPEVDDEFSDESSVNDEMLDSAPDASQLSVSNAADEIAEEAAVQKEENPINDDDDKDYFSDQSNDVAKADDTDKTNESVTGENYENDQSQLIVKAVDTKKVNESSIEEGNEVVDNSPPTLESNESSVNTSVTIDKMIVDDLQISNESIQSEARDEPKENCSLPLSNIDIENLDIIFAPSDSKKEEGGVLQKLIANSNVEADKEVEEIVPSTLLEVDDNTEEIDEIIALAHKTVKEKMFAKKDTDQLENDSSSSSNIESIEKIQEYLVKTTSPVFELKSDTLVDADESEIILKDIDETEKDKTVSSEEPDEIASVVVTEKIDQVQTISTLEDFTETETTVVSKVVAEIETNVTSEVTEDSETVLAADETEEAEAFVDSEMVVISETVTTRLNINENETTFAFQVFEENEMAASDVLEHSLQIIASEEMNESKVIFVEESENKITNQENETTNVIKDDKQFATSIALKNVLKTEISEVEEDMTVPASESVGKDELEIAWNKIVKNKEPVAFKDIEEPEVDADAPKIVRPRRGRKSLTAKLISNARKSLNELFVKSDSSDTLTENLSLPESNESFKAPSTVSEDVGTTVPAKKLKSHVSKGLKTNRNTEVMKSTVKTRGRKQNSLKEEPVSDSEDTVSSIISEVIKKSDEEIKENNPVVETTNSVDTESIAALEDITLDNNNIDKHNDDTYTDLIPTNVCENNTSQSDDNLNFEKKFTTDNWVSLDKPNLETEVLIMNLDDSSDTNTLDMEVENINNQIKNKVQSFSDQLTKEILSNHPTNVATKEAESHDIVSETFDQIMEKQKDENVDKIMEKQIVKEENLNVTENNVRQLRKLPVLSVSSRCSKRLRSGVKCLDDIQQNMTLPDLTKIKKELIEDSTIDNESNAEANNANDDAEDEKKMESDSVLDESTKVAVIVEESKTVSLPQDVGRRRSARRSSNLSASTGVKDELPIEVDSISNESSKPTTQVDLPKSSSITISKVSGRRSSARKSCAVSAPLDVKDEVEMNNDLVLDESTVEVDSQKSKIVAPPQISGRHSSARKSCAVSASTDEVLDDQEGEGPCTRKRKKSNEDAAKARKPVTRNNKILLSKIRNIKNNVNINKPVTCVRVAKESSLGSAITPSEVEDKIDVAAEVESNEPTGNSSTLERDEPLILPIKKQRIAHRPRTSDVLDNSGSNEPIPKKTVRKVVKKEATHCEDKEVVYSGDKISSILEDYSKTCKERLEIERNLKAATPSVSSNVNTPVQSVKKAKLVSSKSKCKEDLSAAENADTDAIQPTEGSSNTPNGTEKKKAKKRKKTQVPARQAIPFEAEELPRYNVVRVPRVDDTNSSLDCTTKIVSYMNECVFDSPEIRRYCKRKAQILLCQRNRTFVFKQLDLLKNSKEWTNEIHSQVLESLVSMQDLHTIAFGIIDYADQEWEAEPMDKSHTPPAPIMPQLEQKLVTLIVGINKRYPGFTDTVIQGLHYTIFRLAKQAKEVQIVERLFRILVVLNKIKKDREKIRIYLCDALYCLGMRAYNVIYVALTCWPEVLPKHSSNNDTLLKAVVHIVMSLPADNTYAKVMTLKNLLSKYYEYPNCGYMTSTLKEELLTNLKENVPGTSTAILLLCKKMGPRWSYDNVFPGVKKTILNITDLSAYDILTLFGNIQRSFPKDDSSKTVVSNIDQLCDLLDGNCGSDEFQEGVVSSLLSISRFRYEQVAKSVIKWQSKLALRESTIEKLKSFFALHDAKWWRKFIDTHFPPTKEEESDK